MFKCKECGTEYEIKPDYCDCGNDEFEVINPEPEPIAKPLENKLSEEKVTQDIPKPQPAKAANFHNNTQDIYKQKRMPTVDSASLAIFLLCIIFSFYIIFFAWNSKENPESLTNEDTVQTTSVFKNIPAIDKIWNNELPQVKKEEPKEEIKPDNIIKQIVVPQPQKQAEAPKKTTASAQSKVTKVTLTKTTATQKTQTKKTNIAVKQQTNTNAQEQAKKAAEEAVKQKAEQERKAAEAAQLKKLQAEQAKKTAEEKAKQEAAAKQEFASYKAKLRNTIGSKIDFTRVIGDGSCTVAFKIDANGKLVSRSFAKQSTNNTLNDAVYAAVMATPTFNPPPSAYKNETLNLSIKFYNGNFEISLQ